MKTTVGIEMFTLVNMVISVMNSKKIKLNVTYLKYIEFVISESVIVITKDNTVEWHVFH